LSKDKSFSQNNANSDGMMTTRKFIFCIVVCLLLLISSCGSGDPAASCASGKPIEAPLVQIATCSGTPATSLPNYDRISAQFLDEETRHPTNNAWGNVVWGTRYYLESLLTAYEATGNRKYIDAFLDSGQWVLNLVQTITVVDAPDSGQPVAPGTAQLKVTGWPTMLNSYGVPVAVPTQTGQIALYAQNLSEGALFFKVTQQSDGSLQLAWTAGNTGDQVLQSNTIQSVADLNALAAAPLVWPQSVGRIKPTGAGLPAPGVYQVNLQVEETMWNSEQAGGILLPFAHFLVLAEEHPELTSQGTREEWTSKVLAIAAGYEGIFISDGQGGLRQHNPLWLPNVVADVDAPMDYISAEATLRLFLYQLTGDPHQLAIATGLILHQQTFHLSVGPQGWLLLQSWPDFVPWSTRANAPSGSVYDSFQYDPSTPSPNTDGEFFTDLLHYAKIFQICLSDYLYNANRAALQQYLFYGSSPIEGSAALLRGYYPRVNSKASDPINVSQDPFAGGGYLTPEVADQSIIDANWKWMQSYAQNPEGQSIGYYLRDWARSEAAELNRCQYAGTSAQ
jgi:hypothetical protein